MESRFIVLSLIYGFVRRRGGKGGGGGVVEDSEGGRQGNSVSVDGFSSVRFRISPEAEAAACLYRLVATEWLCFPFGDIKNCFPSLVLVARFLHRILFESLITSPPPSITSIVYPLRDARVL